MQYQNGVVVKCTENCGNSPKKQLLRDLAIAFVEGNHDFCLEWLRDDLVWTIVGKEQLIGTASFINKQDYVMTLKPTKLHIEHIITHGNIASLNGTLTFKDQSSIDFCHVFQFGGFGKTAKIKKITSYIIT